VERIEFNGEEYELVDDMKNTQHNTLVKRKPFKRKDEVTFELIVLCLLAAFAWGAFLYGLIAWLG